MKRDSCTLRPRRSVLVLLCAELAGGLADLRAPAGEPAQPFQRGDADGSGRLDLSDAVRVLGFLFLGNAELPCLESADADDSGLLDITDATRLLDFLFLGGASL